jgi:hypothetical protein
MDEHALAPIIELPKVAEEKEAPEPVKSESK